MVVSDRPGEKERILRIAFAMLDSGDRREIEFVECAIQAGEDELAWAGLAWAGEATGAPRAFWEALGEVGIELEIGEWGIYAEEEALIAERLKQND
jgi:hypothetical protein